MSCDGPLLSHDTWNFLMAFCNFIFFPLSDSLDGNSAVAPPHPPSLHLACWLNIGKHLCNAWFYWSDVAEVSLQFFLFPAIID